MDCSIILCTYLAVCPHRRTPPTAPYIANTPALRRSLLAVGVSRRTEGRFFYSHHRWRGILKPSSVPLCVIQDMCLALTSIKVGKAFSKVHIWDAEWSRPALAETCIMMVLAARVVMPAPVACATTSARTPATPAFLSTA